jgi:hypothetical protein
MATYRLLLVVAALVAAFSCPSNSDAAADGYTVAYVITAHGKSDVGKPKTCRYDHACKIRSDIFALSFLVSFPSRDRFARISVLGTSRFGEPSCCFFSAGMIDSQIDPSQHPIRLPIFSGKSQPRWGLVTILNNQIGVLYLDFPDIP